MQCNLINSRRCSEIRAVRGWLREREGGGGNKSEALCELIDKDEAVSIIFTRLVIDLV